jgi:phosphoribosylaminoimidazole-succinocarboxamide synthase
MTNQPEGKTKIIRPMLDGYIVAEAKTKRDITAGDGAKHDIIEGKDELATRTTCNVFDYLLAHNIPTAYIGRDGMTTFLTRYCEMTPVEVVIRRVAAGSYLKRHPEVNEGTVFDDLVVEYYLKTKDRNFEGQKLPCDDPLMEYDVLSGMWILYDPKESDMTKGRIGPIDALATDQEATLYGHLLACKKIAVKVFLLLEEVWKKSGGTLIDLKLEFGTIEGKTFLADVVDCDSWRVLWQGLQLSKQGYRDGDDLKRVLEIYRIAAAITDHFPRFRSSFEF